MLPQDAAMTAVVGGKGFSHDSTSGFRYVIGDTFPDLPKGVDQ